MSRQTVDSLIELSIGTLENSGFKYKTYYTYLKIII